MANIDKEIFTFKTNSNLNQFLNTYCRFVPTENADAFKSLDGFGFVNLPITKRDIIDFRSIGNSRQASQMFSSTKMFIH